MAVQHRYDVDNGEEYTMIFVYNDKHIDILCLTIRRAEDAYVSVDSKQRKHRTIDIATVWKGVFFIVRLLAFFIRLVSQLLGCTKLNTSCL